MSNLFGTVSLVILCVPGFLLSQRILGRTRWAENLALSFPIGVQIFTVILFMVNSYLGVQLSQLSGWTILIMLSLILWLVNSGNLWPLVPKLKSFPRSSLIFFGILFFLFLTSFLTAHWFPITDWDAVTLYDFRAKVILRTGWISDTLFRAKFTDYPLLTTLAHWWMRVNGSSTPLPLYPTFIWTFSAAVFTALKKVMSNRTAFWAALFITLSPKLFEQSFVAYSNLPYTIYLILGLIYLHIWSEKGSTVDFVAGILLTLMSFWARTFPFAFASIIAFLLVNKSTRKPFLLLATVVIAVFFNKIPPINIQLFLHTLNFLKWAIIHYYLPYPILFILAAVYMIKNKIRNLYLLIAVTFFWLMIIAGNYYYAVLDPNFSDIPDAAQRTIMFINPAIALLVATVLHKKESALS